MLVYCLHLIIGIRIRIRIQIHFTNDFISTEEELWNSISFAEVKRNWIVDQFSIIKMIFATLIIAQVSIPSLSVHVCVCVRRVRWKRNSTNQAIMRKESCHAIVFILFMNVHIVRAMLKLNWNNWKWRLEWEKNQQQKIEKERKNNK